MGTILDGNIFWLFDATFGQQHEGNIYGHTDFWHYFQRYIYIIGPVIFYFFLYWFYRENSSI